MKETYGIKSSSVLPCYALWETLRQRNAHVFFAGCGRIHQRCFPLIVSADHFRLMAALDEELLMPKASALCLRIDVELNQDILRSA
jgi:hypothetical protein